MLARDRLNAGNSARGKSLQCFLQLAGGRKAPISAAAVNVRKRAKRTGREGGAVYSVRLSELLGSSLPTPNAHRPASSNPAPRIALGHSHRPAATDASIEHRRRPRLEDLRFWRRRVPRPVTNVHDSGVCGAKSQTVGQLLASGPRATESRRTIRAGA